MSSLFKYFSPQILVQRNWSRHPYKWRNEGIQYPGFKYYPRTPDFKDPPYEPTKLFRVELIKPLKGLNPLERNILEEFKLAAKKHTYAVVKNIPENNGRLWKVKHLVKIVPITFPDGFPKRTDVTYLKENGELRIIKDLTAQEKKIELTDNFKQENKAIVGQTLRKESRLRWLSGWQTTF